MTSMTNQTVRKISNPGRLLQRARRQEKLTKNEVADRLGVTVRTITYLEAWDLKQLCVDDRTLRRYVRDFALTVDLNPTQFDAIIPRSRAPVSSTKPMVIMSKRLSAVIVALIALSAIGFVGWRTYSASAVPQLTITAPPSGYVSTAPTVTVTGITSQRAQVYVNRASVPVDGDGAFFTDVILSEGANTVHVVSVNTFGRQAEADVVVVYQP